MSTTLLEQLNRLTEAHAWESVVNLTREIRAMDGPAVDRATASYLLGIAHWHLGRDPWDYTLAVRYLRQAAKVQDQSLGARVLRNLGSMLVTIGRFAEGRQILQVWITEFGPENPGYIADAQYSIGYAYRYEGRPVQAALWYRQALAGFTAAGNTEWIHNSSCALVQALAKGGRLTQARELLDSIPIGGSHEAYRLKAATELLAAEGNTDAAMATGELAAEHLLELEDQDSWELAELHALLARLQFQAGHMLDRDMHADLAMDCLRASKRHDLLRMVCLLLDHEREEVV
ncbi:MAG TPA: tetratricopeptide repeat protein [Symbiobacteriaceae bacterium]|nr:tetratricopeptide repeat protein [Symbiobacteriaceae bacterium]